MSFLLMLTPLHSTLDHPHLLQTSCQGWTWTLLREYKMGTAGVLWRGGWTQSHWHLRSPSMRCPALQPQGSPNPPRPHPMERPSPNRVPPTDHQRLPRPPMDHPKQPLSPPMDLQNLSLPTLRPKQPFPHILHPRQQPHLTLHPNLRRHPTPLQKPPYHRMALRPWLVRRTAEVEGEGCRMPLIMPLLPAMVPALQPGRRRAVEGRWDSFSWYAPCSKHLKLF